MNNKLNVRRRIFVIGETMSLINTLANPPRPGFSTILRICSSNAASEKLPWRNDSSPVVCWKIERKVSTVLSAKPSHFCKTKIHELYCLTYAIFSVYANDYLLSSRMGLRSSSESVPRIEQYSRRQSRNNTWVLHPFRSDRDAAGDSA